MWTGDRQGETARGGGCTSHQQIVKKQNTKKLSKPVAAALKLHGRVCVRRPARLCTSSCISETPVYIIHTHAGKEVKVGPKSEALYAQWFVHCVAWEPLCPQNTSNLTELSAWQSEIAVIHSSIALFWLLWQGETFPWQLLSRSLSSPPLPSLHRSFLRLSAPYVPTLPTILGLASTWADMWGWKEVGSAGGKKGEEETAGNV